MSERAWERARADRGEDNRSPGRIRRLRRRTVRRGRRRDLQRGVAPPPRYRHGDAHFAGPFRIRPARARSAGTPDPRDPSAWSFRLGGARRGRRVQPDEIRQSRRRRLPAGHRPVPIRQARSFRSPASRRIRRSWSRHRIGPREGGPGHGGRTRRIVKPSAHDRWANARHPRRLHHRRKEG